MILQPLGFLSKKKRRKKLIFIILLLKLLHCSVFINLPRTNIFFLKCFLNLVSNSMYYQPFSKPAEHTVRIISQWTSRFQLVGALRHRHIRSSLAWWQPGIVRSWLPAEYLGICSALEYFTSSQSTDDCWQIRSCCFKRTIHGEP